MFSRALLFKTAIAIGLGSLMFFKAQPAQAQDWGRYYHWPADGGSQQFQWSPYEYEKVYDGGYRYPKEMRVYQTKHGNRNWESVRKPYYRGYHFILDRF